MDMDFIKVDPGKCTRCGVCAAVCPGVIGMGGKGPQAIQDLCVSCGQCVAACPEGALDNTHAPLANQVPAGENTVLDPGTAARFLRSRRSVRNYQPKTVSRDMISQLLDIARMAPTACNSQGVAYHVVDHGDTLWQISAAVIDWTERELKTSAMAAAKYAPHLAMMVEQYRRKGEDVVLRSAPCLIAAAAEEHSFATGRDNTYIAFAYLQLFATSLGLGTCWAGLFEYCAASGYAPLLKLLNLPENMQITSGMMVGYPQYTYHRLVARHPLQVTWQ